MTFKYLLNQVNIPQGNIFQIEGEKIPNEEAKRYSGVLRNNLRLVSNLPKFDIMFLGIGDDGHTASIFSDQMYLLDSDNYCEVSLNPSSGQKRITLTGKVINNSDRIYFLVSGKNKSQILKDIMNKENNYIKYPASYIAYGNAKINWFIDKEAASLLNQV